MLLGTFGAQTEYVKFMIVLNITVLFHKLILDFFKLRAVNFFVLAAFETNKMVMVLMAVLVLVAKGAI